MSQSQIPQTWKPFVSKANAFLEKTEAHALQGVSPGGYYQAVWCRDASYILRDWFLSGNVDGTLLQLSQIWSHQIRPNREKFVYGRGSPEMDFSAEVADAAKEKEFEGALPTTIYQVGFSETYGKNPDIDSTALMISTTSWILGNWSLKHKEASAKGPEQKVVASQSSADFVSGLLAKIGATDLQKVTDFTIPCMIKAVDYLAKRDIDGDGLLEQKHNEDWMDTALRAGKMVYSQACWIIALNDLSILLSNMGQEAEAKRMRQLRDKALDAVDQKLWSQNDGCYVNLQETHGGGEKYTKTFTEDTSFYLVAMTADTELNSLRLLQKAALANQEPPKPLDHTHYQRASSTLEAIKSRMWIRKWPVVTEGFLKETGPWILKPYEYHNQTCWPWIAAVEMMARARFDRIDECNTMLSAFTSQGGEPEVHA
ncbi:MAG: glycoside hydrolase family 116 protein, partial [Nitrososphaera sp.]|nr:glycoside hydrolase family 116 protein [Nitrososphaera sp.]